MAKRIILIIFMIVAIASFAYAEGIDENTVLMLHMDDAGLIDSSDSSHAITKNGDAALNTGTYKFSPGSAYFDGEGDYLSLADSDDWNFGTGDFTIDFWINITAYPTSVWTGLIATERIYSPFTLLLGRQGYIHLFCSGTAGIAWDVAEAFVVSSATPLNTWTHIAIVRSSGNFYAFNDGILITGPTPGAGALYDGTEDLRIGKWATYLPFNGYIDELRISKGIARWTSDFTPPSEPYSTPPPTPFATCGDTVPYEGQNYNTVLIGEQCWFAENLNVGTKVTGVTTQSNNALIEKYCYNDDEAICTTDGGLYQWNEAMQYVTTEGAQGICPSGWHIPTHDEFTTLEQEVCTSETCETDFPYDTIAGGYRGTDEGDKLKKSGLVPDICYGATPPCGTSGFECLLAGYRYSDGYIYNRGSIAYFWSSLESGVDAWLRYLRSSLSTVWRWTDSKVFGFSVRCIQNPSTTTTSSNFTSTETTNFSTVADITNVTNLTLAVTGKGKIKFPESTEINAEAQDYDTNIVIEDEFISVNTAALDESFNTSATITLKGVTCPVATITYQEGTFTSKDDIISGGKNCELDGVCSNIQCIGTNLTFDVLHFTGFAAGADANLTTEAQAGVFYPLDPIEFTAEYINSTDGTPISGECNITFDDDWDTEYTMDFNTSDYNYTKSFVTAAMHEYNVTCSSANFVTLEANDTKLVSSVDIPEFSTITLGLGLIAILIGLVVIRKKN